MQPRLGDSVELELPLQPQLFFLARMTAAAIASHANFDPQQIDDLRLGVDELLLTLTRDLIRSDDASSFIRVEFQWHVDVMDVAATLVGGAGEPLATQAPDTAREDTERSISESILEAVVDEHGAGGPGEVPRVWLRLRRSSAL